MNKRVCTQCNYETECINIAKNGEHSSMTYLHWVCIPCLFARMEEGLEDKAEHDYLTWIIWYCRGMFRHKPPAFKPEHISSDHAMEKVSLAHSAWEAGFTKRVECTKFAKNNLEDAATEWLTEIVGNEPITPTTVLDAFKCGATWSDCMRKAREQRGD